MSVSIDLLIRIKCYDYMHGYTQLENRGEPYENGSCN